MSSIIGPNIDPNKVKQWVERPESERNTLTGLPSGNVLMSSGKQILDYSKQSGARSAFLLARIESLWKIYWGVDYPSGLEVWKLIGERFRSIVPENAYLGHPATGIVAHMWDIESDQEAADMAQRMIDVFSEPFSIGGRSFYLYCNVGYLIYPDDTCEVDKRRITQCVTSAVPSEFDGHRHTMMRYSSEVLEMLNEREWLDQNIIHARNNNELRMVYQPRVDLSDGSVVGAEALMRWQHPERGEISPDLFITRAEEIGEIEALTRFSLSTICNDVAEFRGCLPQDFRISVNISRMLFAQPGFDLVSMIAAAVEKSKCPYELLELEITETSFLGESSYESVNAQLTELKQRGVTVAIDDFGTGHSSIRCISTLPIDTVKIDKSFLADMDTNSNATRLIFGMQNIASALGKLIVAEGVESQEQVEILQNLGIELAQGFYFYKPMEKAKLLYHLSKKRAA